MTPAKKPAVRTRPSVRTDPSRRAVGPQGERTRRKLLDAARVTFKERGYPATRVDDIARQAGTSHGAFYLYFANKADILEALAVETSERMINLADELEGIELGEAGYRHIRNWVDTFVRSYAQDAPVLNAWVQGAAEDSRFDRLGRELLGRYAARIAKAIERSVKRDGRRSVDPGIAATALVAMLERVCYFWLVRGADFDHEQGVETLTTLCYQAIFGAQPELASADRG
jgi:AcrR family transcriptional regulator